ncbi:MAG: SsrA-binding protein SmpB [Candidatus Omnitrophota bacterium]|nr:SsrA-binding protein SmpB [Candidatus Omnitrophota bacterium]
MSNTASTNRKAFRDYVVLETLECGIELKGGEVKSIRDGRMNLEDSFARIDKGEMSVYNIHISPYTQASYMNVEPTRVRKLLLHKRQIIRLMGKVTQKGLTLVPLKLYFNERGFAKIELGLCKGKKLFDKREDIKRREVDLTMRRAMRNVRK